ncbi:MAG: tetratricopeptide repeat protein [Actinomycetota bacterium]|nr:tetratricopeptide repeat protein [Actinomycetota bacterium]
MRDLPTGTVTFLFSDIEGSTRLLHEHGDRYAELLAEHRRVLRDVFVRQGGVEVDTQGDAFFAAFSQASNAAAAGEEIRKVDSPVKVRIGIHTGEPIVTAEGYVGIDVHRAARICAAAHGGQVVLSSRTAELLDETAVRDLGMHRLKDLGEPQKLFQLGDGEFPPLRSLNATNLPAQPGPLVGRDRELAELAELTRTERVVTLIGPGGSGKTRLALHAAAESVGAFDDGVLWVPLAAITDPEIVEPEIGRTIGAQNGLADHIDEKRMLLLLDNLEQLLPAVAARLARLGERCPNLHLLLTSRAPLRIAAEREYAVDPLPETDAVALFRQRAFVSEPEDTVHEICRRLDGLPLAIELAAARTRVLTLDRLLERLGRALPVLTGGRRDAPERQQTLRSTIEWSYDLLPAEERQLFARLAVFAGSFTAESAEAVCGASLDRVEALVEHSLVRRWETGRLGMLETIRELALEKLEESDEADVIRRRHAEYLLELAQSANLSLKSLGQGPQRHELVLPEQHNLRAALDWTVESDPELGLRLAVALENFWVTQDSTEGVRRFEALLDRAGDVDLALHARAMLDYGGCADWSGDYERAGPAYARSGELFREAGDENGVAEATFRIGVIASRVGDHGRARRLWEDSLATWQRLGDTVGELQALGNLGWLEFEEGDPERGRELVERSLAMSREVGWTWWEVAQLGNLAEHALEDGKTDEGERQAREYLALARTIEDRTNTVFGLGLLAWAAADRADVERATTLWAAVEAEEAKGPLAMWTSERHKYAAHIPAAAGTVPELTLEEAVAYALSSVD